MEDENELPYLLSEKRDKFSSGSDNLSNEEKLNRILNSMNISTSERSILKDKLISFLNAKDCKGLKVEDYFDAYNFIFTRENKYVRTENRFEYIPGFETQRIFNECYTTHNHDNLLRDSLFKDLIKKTPLEFIDCSGGYELDYSMARDEFNMLDEVDIKVSFRAGPKNRLYRLDLDKMELSENYFEYD